MARRKKKKQAKRPRPARGGGSFSLGKAFSVKLVINILLCIGIVGGAFYGAYYFFLNSSFFAIKEIVVNKDRSYSFQEGERRIRQLYLGRNLLAVDLNQVRTLIRSEFPQLEKVEVRKNMPDELEVDIVSRTPAAVLDTSGGVIVDAEGYVLATAAGTNDLVKIKGISFFLSTPSRGERINNRSLIKALELLDEINKKMRWKKANIDYINISDRNNIVLNIEGVPVKMGTEDFGKKVSELKDILQDPNVNTKDINYIDLRFEDAVISLK